MAGRKNKGSVTDLPAAHCFKVGDEVIATGGFHAVVESTDGENVRIHTEDGLCIVTSAFALWHAGAQT